MQDHDRRKTLFISDPILLALVLGLLMVGFITITSTTLFVAERQYQDPFFFVVRHVKHVLLALVVFFMARSREPSSWQAARGVCLLFACVSLLLVFVPGLGLEINGAKRWIRLGITVCQPSEISKLCYLLYLASYLSQETERIRRSELLFWVRPMVWLLVCATLLCLQPDFGSAIVLTTVTLITMFIAGMPLRTFIVLGLLAVTLAGICAVVEPYRMLRIISFTNPWKYAYGTGYQLTQSLMAVGRGGVWGVGLGSGLQKIFYLPEAHTDFIFAVFCEELGMVGGVCLLVIYLILVIRLLSWAYHFEKKRLLFMANYTTALSSWIGIQTVISVGVNLGVLPTKGLSLPLLSYGGTHIAVSFFALGVLSKMLQSSHEGGSHLGTGISSEGSIYERF